MKVDSFWWPQFLEKEDRIMAGLKRSSLPVVKFGRSASEPSATVSENGQLRLNRLAIDALGKTKVTNRKGKDRAGADITTKVHTLYVDYNEEKRTLSVCGAIPKGWSDEDAFQLVESKGGGGYISMAGAFRQMGYDFAKSGNQTIPVVVNAEKQLVRIVVPQGALTPVPKKERKVKASAAAAKGAEPGDIDID